jgi:hypothetical protein
MIKSRRMNWTGHVGRMGERILVGESYTKGYKGDLDAGERAILTWITER